MNQLDSFVEVARLARESGRAAALASRLDQFIEQAVPAHADARLLGELRRTRGIKRLSDLCRQDTDTFVRSRFGGPTQRRLALGLWDWIRRCFPPSDSPAPTVAPPPRPVAPPARPVPPPPRPAPERPVVSDPPAEVQSGGRPTTAAQLRAWAETRRVLPFLSFPAPQAADQDPLSLEQVLLRPDRRQQRAWEQLQQFADNVAHLDEREAERRRGQPPPPSANAVALSGLLRRLRDERPTPLPARERGAFIPAPLRFFDHPPRLVYDEGEDPRSAVVLGYRLPQLVTIRLGGLSTGEVEASCACEPGADGCAHLRAALDAAVDLCARPDLPAHADVMAVLGVPPWQRLMARLDENLGRLRPRPDDAELIWCVGPDPAPDRPPRLEARLARISPEGPTSVERLALRELDGRADLLASPLDARAAALVRLGLDEARAAQTSLGPARIFRVLESLCGAHNVYGLDDGSLAGRVEVRRVQPTAVLHTSPDGSIEVRVRIGDRLFSAEELSRLAPDRRHVFRVDPGAGRCDIALLEARWQALLDALLFCPAALPPEGAEQLLRRLHLLQPEIEVDLPAELRGDTRPADPTVVFRLRPRSSDQHTGLWVEVCVRPLPGGPLWAPGEGPDLLLHQEGGRRLSLERDLPGERERAGAALAAIGLLAEGESARQFRFELSDQQQALDVVARLAEGLPGVVAEWPADSWRLRGLRRADLRVRVEGHHDWLGVQGGVEIDGEIVSLASIIEALRQGRRYLSLGPQKFAIIEAELRSRLEGAMDHLHPTRAGVELPAAAVPALDDLVTEASNLSFADSARAQLQRLQQAQQHEPRVSAGLRATLRPYQLAGFRWMSQLAAAGVGGCLADDMGLGKTLQVLALLLERAPLGPALVVAPTSVTQVWIQQASRFAPDLRVRRYAGPGREAALVGLGPGDLVVASYGVVVRDAEKLGQTTWSALVLDEAQAIKNARSTRARAVRSLPADWRLALTGTPIENHVGELWSIFRVVSPAVLGGWDWFRERFAAPIERDGDGARREALARVLRPYLLRRTKESVAPELPPRLELDHFVELSADERRAYEQIRLATLATLGKLGLGPAPLGPRGQDDGRFQVLAALTRLRQLACHPRLLDHDSQLGSSKLDALLELLTTQKETGHRTLVFSQFTRLLDLAEARIAAAGMSWQRLDGSTSVEERERRVAAFQAGQGDVFLISLRAGGSGLTLTAADTVVHLDPWWNPAVEDQATDRTHRIGQDRPVTVVRLVARGTVEEAVLSLHVRKRALASAILENPSAAEPLTTEDLIALLGAADPDAADEDAEPPAA